MMVFNVQVICSGAHFGYFGHFNGARVIFEDFAVYSCIFDSEWDAFVFGFPKKIEEMNDLPRSG
jgi:hypothetical protein